MRISQGLILPKKTQGLEIMNLQRWEFSGGDDEINWEILKSYKVL